MPKALNIVPDKCTGCMQCELACAWVQTGTFAPSQSLIRVSVFDEEASYAPYTCVQCDEAWCMNACPVNAIALDTRDRRQGGHRRAVHRLPPVHDRVSVRHGVHAAAVRPCREVQPVRRAAGVRQRRVPTQAIVYGESTQPGQWLESWGAKVHRNHVDAFGG